MTGVHDMTPAVHLRSVEDQDIEVFFEHQADPQAVEMAAFPARDRDQVAAHWRSSAGTTPSWCARSLRMAWWPATSAAGRSRTAAARLLDRARVLGPRRRDSGPRPARRGVSIRPLYAHVVTHNVGSIRVLENAGFGAIPWRKRRRLRPTTASRSSSTC